MSEQSNNVNLLEPGEADKLETWLECYRKLGSNVEYQRDQLDNLALMKNYSAESYKQYISSLENVLDALNKRLDKVQQSIKDVNLARKISQIRLEEKIEHLQTEWKQQVETNFILKRAIDELAQK